MRISILDIAGRLLIASTSSSSCIYRVTHSRIMLTELAIQDELVVDDDPLFLPDIDTDDADGDVIGGYLWKFPSEGSNMSVQQADVDDCGSDGGDVYPRKCSQCQTAWVSSFANERRHWKTCSAATTLIKSDTPDPSHAHKQSVPANQQAQEQQFLSVTKLGVARRVWCEVDAALTRLQWRPDRNGVQEEGELFSVPFSEILDVIQREQLDESFDVVTTSGRRVVFQYRANAAVEAAGIADRGLSDIAKHQQPAHGESTDAQRSLNAGQWRECLLMFSRFARGDQDQAKEKAMDSQQGKGIKESSLHDSNGHAVVLKHISRAIAANDVDALQDLLTLDDLVQGPSLVDANGSSLLVIAFDLGACDEILSMLLKAGVDCNAQNKDGESPLLLAAASGELRLVRLLLEQDDKLNIDQRCALGATAFHAAANAGDLDILRELCDAGADTAAVDENGWTALHYAAACTTGCGAMHLLCELTPDLVDHQCSKGNTALHVAAGYGCLDNVRALLETAANPHLTNDDGQTAYHVSLHNHHVQCAMAVHEYMKTPRDAYEKKHPATTECGEPNDQTRVVDADADSTHHTEILLRTYSHEVESAPLGYGDGEHDEDAGDAWSEYWTDDGLAYYYNHVTGESTWHRPDAFAAKASFVMPPPAPVILSSRAKTANDDKDTTGVESAGELDPTNGENLPVCMIPLVSPLISLDDPTAVTKLESRRRKDREKRRRHRFTKQRLRGGALAAAFTPPPPTELVSSAEVAWMLNA